MKVSVIIPVYNVKSYLERCVHSVLKQTYKNLEIILVDDGSTDGSSEICDRFADNYPNIIVTHQQNQGASVARNTGIRMSKGEYVAFLDSDDEWLLSDGLERLLKGDDADLIVFKRVDIWKEKSSVTCADYNIGHIAQLSNTETVFSHLVSTQQLQISACFQLVRRQVLLDHDIYFPPGMLSEDIFWSIQLWQHLSSVRFINLPFYAYHHREASITTTVSIRTFHSYDQIFTYWKEQCDEGCINADAIRAFLANMWVSRGYAYQYLTDNEKPEAVRILQKHSDLLAYGLSPKSKRARRLVQSVGVKATVVVLKWYWKLRSYIKN